MKIELESEKLLGFRLYSEDGQTGAKCGGKRGDKPNGPGPIVRGTKTSGMAGGKDGGVGRTPGGMAGGKDGGRPRPV